MNEHQVNIGTQPSETPLPSAAKQPDIDAVEAVVSRLSESIRSRREETDRLVKDSEERRGQLGFRTSTG